MSKEHEKNLTQKRLKEVLQYDPDTGVFLWKKQINPRGKVGQVAGCVRSRGYRTIGIDGNRYYSGRLAWYYMTGSWPPHQIDHKDRDKSNDLWENLRLATESQNKMNQRNKPRRDKLPRGVHKYGERYKAVFREKILGYFSTAQEAYSVYLAEAIKTHGEFVPLEVKEFQWSE
jgi:hypothetical protein